VIYLCNVFIPVKNGIGLAVGICKTEIRLFIPVMILYKAVYIINSLQPCPYHLLCSIGHKYSALVVFDFFTVGKVDHYLKLAFQVSRIGGIGVLGFLPAFLLTVICSLDGLYLEGVVLIVAESDYSAYGISDFGYQLLFSACIAYSIFLSCVFKFYSITISVDNPKNSAVFSKVCLLSCSVYHLILGGAVSLPIGEFIILNHNNINHSLSFYKIYLLAVQATGDCLFKYFGAAVYRRIGIYYRT